MTDARSSASTMETEQARQQTEEEEEEEEEEERSGWGLAGAKVLRDWSRTVQRSGKPLLTRHADIRQVGWNGAGAGYNQISFMGVSNNPPRTLGRIIRRRGWVEQIKR